MYGFLFKKSCSLYCLRDLSDACKSKNTFFVMLAACFVMPDVFQWILEVLRLMMACKIYHNGCNLYHAICSPVDAGRVPMDDGWKLYHSGCVLCHGGSAHWTFAEQNREGQFAAGSTLLRNSKTGEI